MVWAHSAVLVAIEGWVECVDATRKGRPAERVKCSLLFHEEIDEADGQSQGQCNPPTTMLQKMDLSGCSKMRVCTNVADEDT